MTTETMWMVAACLALGMAFTIRQARRSATRLRMLLTGPSGSGKTWGALVIAKGIGGRTVVIDTEQGSSDLYDDLHDFGVIDLDPPYTPERYIEAIKTAEDRGAEVIIIDSITHEWAGDGGCLQLVDEIAKARFKGNTWSAFSEITPRHRAFLDAMLRSKAHIIATARSKTETAQVNDGGRVKVVKLGMAAETRQGAEYEFTLVLDITHDGHFASASKDRTTLFAGDPKPLSEETGRRIAEWLAGGVEVTPTAQEEKRPGWLDRIGRVNDPDELDNVWDEARRAASEGRLTEAQIDRLSKVIATRRAELEVAAAGKGVRA